MKSSDPGRSNYAGQGCLAKHAAMNKPDVRKTELEEAIGRETAARNTRRERHDARIKAAEASRPTHLITLCCVT